MSDRYYYSCFLAIKVILIPLFITCPFPVSCADLLSPLATSYWSSLCLTSVWRLMDSLPTTPVSLVVLRSQQWTQELAQGPFPRNLQLDPFHVNVLPLPSSRLPPPPSMCHLLALTPPREPDRSSLRELVDRAPQPKTGGRQSQSRMERGLVSEVMCTHVCPWTGVVYIYNALYLCVMFLVPQNPLCAKACKRDGTIKTSFCASEFGTFVPVHIHNK